MKDKWNTTTVDPSQEPEPISEQVMNENLGHTSQFVGLMDTEEKVRGHLDAVKQYQTVYSNLLHSGQFNQEEIKRAYCSEWVSCAECESPHGACVDVCAKEARGAKVVETFGFGPDMDAALAADDAKLEGLGAYDLGPQIGGIPAAELAKHHPYCRSLYVGTAKLGCDCAALAQAEQVASANAVPQVQQRSPLHAVELETARLAWKDAVAKRNTLMAQWDAYVAECRAHYQRLKHRQ